jgi:mRNA interferase RelE/StbE
MAWKVEVLPDAKRDLKKLDRSQAQRIVKFLYDRVAKLENPRSIGEALQGPRFGEFWKYRIGDYRVVCKLLDERVIVLVLRVGHRKEIYR